MIIARLFSGVNYLQLEPISKTSSGGSLGQKLEIFVSPTSKTVNTFESDPNNDVKETLSEEKTLKLGNYSWLTGVMTYTGESSFYAQSLISKQYLGHTEKFALVIANGYTSTGPESSKFDQSFADISKKILATIEIK
ncbi:MAG: hypothetical protein AAB563_01225 [Patescibacteria group bacterium]